MTPSRSRRRRPRTRPHSKFSSETFSKLEGRSKFAVFIRDVPSIGHVPIATRFLEALAKLDVYPVYYYSIMELLKDKRNVDKIQLMASKQNGKKPRKVTGTTVVKGCNLLMKHLFERAIRSTPELIVIDYLSETVVDGGRLSSVPRKLGYNVIFLKRSFYQDSQPAIDRAVDLISSSIKYQNHAEIWCQREADKWWHEMEKIYLPHDIGVNRPRAAELLDNSDLSDVYDVATGTGNGTGTGTDISSELSSRARQYLHRLEDVARLLDGESTTSEWTGTDPPGYEPNVRYHADNTLIVVHDDNFPEGPGRPRLFESLMDKLLQEGFQVHVIPVGELVVLPRFQSLLEWFCKRSDMDMMDTYSYLFLDAFNTLYSNEKIVVLDNIHEGIVMSSYYISRAIDKDWEVIILSKDQCWPPADQKSVQQVISHLKRKYFNEEENIGMGRNHAVGDYFGYE